MRIASPFIMIIHVIGSLREADVGQQSADTIKLNFRFRCPRRCARSKVGDQTTKVLAIYVVERGKPLATAWPPFPPPASRSSSHVAASRCTLRAAAT
jgi:hypothetical protein